MALIKCSECGKEISDSADMCPHCGCKTVHGTTTAQTKSLGIQYIVEFITLIIGLVLLFSALPELTDHSSYYWEYGLWREDTDTTTALWKLFFGAVLILGSIITMICLNMKAKELQGSPNLANEFQNTGNSESIDIPEDKRRYGVCEKCRLTGTVAVCRIPSTDTEHKLCSRCISKYDAHIK